jgi:hypothetical protein
MKLLIIVIAVFVMVVGGIAMLAPDRLFALGQFVATTTGLYVVGAIRSVIGLVLILGAPRSRAPRTFRVIGAVVVVAGLATPIFGVERTRAVLAWEADQGSASIRVGGAIAVAMGGLLAFAMKGRGEGASLHPASTR